MTIYDIACELNISVGTVNRALHNKPRVSEETRQRVLETAERLNFRLSDAAQSLRRKPIHIGVLLFCTLPQYINEIKRGMEAAFDKLEQYNVFGSIRITDLANHRNKKGNTYEHKGFNITPVACDHGELAPHAVGLIITSENITVYITGDTAFRPDIAYEICEAPP